jgi:LEA14-like dessication related protein
MAVHIRPLNIFLRFAPRAAILVIIAVSIGCSSLSLQKPTAMVRGMSVQGVNAQGFAMNFDVDVQNPNSVALPLASADYKLGVGGVDLLEGNAKPDGSLPAGGSRSFVLPVAVTFENLVRAEKAIQGTGGNVAYDLSGGLAFDTGTPLLGQLRVPLRYSGTLAVADLLKDPRVFLGSEAGKRLAAIVLGRTSGQ